MSYFLLKNDQKTSKRANRFNLSFFLAQERPRPAPRICPCENGGFCEDTGPDNKLICNCLPGFSGETCDVYQEISLQKGTSTGYSIILAILACFIIAGLIGAAYFIYKKKPL